MKKLLRKERREGGRDREREGVRWGRRERGSTPKLLGASEEDFGLGVVDDMHPLGRRLPSPSSSSTTTTSTTTSKQTNKAKQSNQQK
eukprot:871161-Rhodomonas_salina.1